MEQLLPFVNTILYTWQLIYLSDETVLVQSFDENHVLLSLRSREGVHEMREKSITIFAPKNYVLIDIPTSETGRPLATYVARTGPRNFVTPRLPSHLARER